MVCELLGSASTYALLTVFIFVFLYYYLLLRVFGYSKNPYRRVFDYLYNYYNRFIISIIFYNTLSLQFIRIKKDRNRAVIDKIYLHIRSKTTRLYGESVGRAENLIEIII